MSQKNHQRYNFLNDDFKPVSPISPLKTSVLAGCAGGVAGSITGAKIASLILTLKSVADTVKLAAEEDKATFTTVMNAAHTSAASNIEPGTLASMSGMAMHGFETAAIVSAGIRETSLLATVLVKAGVTSTIMGLLIGGTGAFIIVGGSLICYNRQNQNKFEQLQKLRILIESEKQKAITEAIHAQIIKAEQAERKAEIAIYRAQKNENHINELELEIKKMKVIMERFRVDELVLEENSDADRLSTMLHNMIQTVNVAKKASQDSLKNPV